MNATRDNSKVDKASQAEQEFAKLLSAAQAPGFYGTASLTVNLQDGHIQHLRIAIDRMIK